MKIRVYNDNQFIFEGSLKEFLQDNDNDPDLIEVCKELNNKNTITFNFYHSGSWTIEKIPTELKILLKENLMFGGYVGRLVNPDLTTLELPIPFLTDHIGYTGRDKDKIINQCKDDAATIFNIIELEIIDNTI